MDANDERRGPEWEAVEEAGGGVSEGFEQAEADLIENASHGDGTGDPEADAIDNELEEGQASTAEYGEADELDSPDS